MINLRPDQDLVRRYLFGDAPDICAATVRLTQACQEMLDHQNMPDAVARLCKEMAAAVSILAHMLKFDGEMIIQIKGNGPIRMLVAECSSSGILRATGQWCDVNEKMSFQELVGSGYLSVTIDPERGERYQGIVGLDKETLSDCLNAYFKNSEQLDAKIWLSADDETASGLFVQKISGNDGTDFSEEEWITTDALAHTITVDELIADAGPLLTYRLFHKLQPRSLPPWPVKFGCSCSHQRSSGAFRALGGRDVKMIFQKQREVTMTCLFCGQVYQYDRADLQWLLSDQPRRSDILQ